MVADTDAHVRRGHPSESFFSSPRPFAILVVACTPGGPESLVGSDVQDTCPQGLGSDDGQGLSTGLGHYPFVVCGNR